MSKPPRGASFASEPLDEFGTFHELRSDHLDCDRPLGSEMRAEIHCAHSAAAELTFDLVFAVEGLPDKIRKVHTQSPSSTEE